MILLMPPYATTAAMVGEVDLAMVVVKRSKCKALKRCFFRYRFRAINGIEEL